uniref:SFRICE_032425 n=1 Tax=Spodoptera frugiperda TaxID=7108 RepID=A0A2H1VEW2_SPOFR
MNYTKSFTMLQLNPLHVMQPVAQLLTANNCRGLGFDSRVGRSITGLFSVFRKFLNGSTESGNVPEVLEESWPVNENVLRTRFPSTKK